METQIQKIINSYKEFEKDGWTRPEMVRFGLDCIEILIPEAQQFNDMAGKAKKQWVIDTLKNAYFLVNPDIPWVPEPIETAIERFTVPRVIEQIISPAIDWLVEFMKKKGLL